MNQNIHLAEYIILQHNQCKILSFQLESTFSVNNCDFRNKLYFNKIFISTYTIYNSFHPGQFARLLPVKEDQMSFCSRRRLFMYSADILDQTGSTCRRTVHLTPLCHHLPSVTCEVLKPDKKKEVMM